MDEKIKEIIAAFLKIPVGEIHPDLVIDRSALKNSIVLHRFYARLDSAGVTIENYADVRTVRDLMQAAGQSKGADIHPMPNGDAPLPAWSGETHAPGIGIDIEEVAAMPVAADFREDEFYRMNFTPREIAYCILRPDPYASFAGLFAAKEAIVKSSEVYRKRPFNKIEIDHSPEGRPLHNGFQISISHAGKMSVAVAVSREPRTSPEPAIFSPTEPSPAKKGSYGVWVGWLSLLLSVLAILLILLR